MVGLAVLKRLAQFVSGLIGFVIVLLIYTAAIAGWLLMCLARLITGERPIDPLKPYPPEIMH